MEAWNKETDIAFMKDHRNWPSSRLAVKKTHETQGKFPYIGFMLPQEPNVYLGCFDDALMFSDEEIHRSANNGGVKVLNFASLEEAVEAGWMVD